MIQKLLCLLFTFTVASVAAQKKSEEFRIKKVLVVKDTIQIDSVSINPLRFKVFDTKKVEIPSKNYTVDFAKAILILDKNNYSEVSIHYYRYPDFLTKTYSAFSKKLIVPNGVNTGKLYSLTTNIKREEKPFFEGLDTKGFIARGITVGNNQNAVTNASLDLTISGKLSEKVGIRANIFDTNFPLQQNGYSQNITDFDRIFIELFSDNWKIKAGDVSLQNSNSIFLDFEKQVAGLEVSANVSKKAKVSASGAVVRGKFSAFNFVGVEGNQGPYKIFGPNNEPAIVIVAGSEKVFVNGLEINRGETKDYTIDYNLAEIRFSTRYPITNDMRIRVEFQFSDRNYTRFITYEKAQYASDKLKIRGHFYSENDAKNQPIQQSLTDAQKQILANAGNNEALMVAPSAFEDSFSADRIQYKKTLLNTQEVFEYSTDPNETLFFVTFTNVGANNGDYVVDQTIATGTIFRYVGTNLGSYAPITRLVAPTSLQVFDIEASYQPTEKTILSTEIALSNNDKNLFSEIDNNQNKKLAADIKWKQVLLDKKWKLNTDFNYQFIEDNFTSVQRFLAVEFNRDWNILNPTGDLKRLSSGFILSNTKKGFINYSFNNLEYANSFSGQKHILNSQLRFNDFKFNLRSSLLDASSILEDNQFTRVFSSVEKSFNRVWAGAQVDFESNQIKDAGTNTFVNRSHKFLDYGTYLGLGDTTKVFAKFGVAFRTNDSIRSNTFQQINNRKTFFIDSKLIQNNRTNLSVYVNYRITENMFSDDEKALNSRVNYSQRFFDQFLQLNTVYESSSGNVARQDFVYVKTEPGQGFYTWIDYNNDGVQQFEEFEVAQFQDQADYLRVPLPNLRYLPTQRAKLQQTVILNPRQWSAENGLKKWLSKFYNQTYLLLDNEQLRQGNGFNFNPFNLDESNLLSLIFNIRNSVYFNRNLQDYSFTYTYGKSRSKQQFSIGTQENTSLSHQLTFEHKLSKFWVFDITGSVAEDNLVTENFVNRNFQIDLKKITPKLTFYYNKNHKFSMFYEYHDKQNKLQNFEVLQQQKLGAEYFLSQAERGQISASLNLFFNDFSGNPNSPVGYQMLEGLQTGKNYTWNVLFNRKLNSYLNLNLNYLGRKSEASSTIHTGMIQLKAIF